VIRAGLQIRQLTSGDDLGAEFDLRDRAFGPIEPSQRAGWIDGLALAVADGRLFGAFDGSVLIGSARFHDMRQWWHGRSLPAAAVAGVKVAPECRGQGIGTALMTALLAELARRRYPVSVLYPATVSLYRSLGFELAGARYETVLPARSLGSLISGDFPAQQAAGALRRAVPDDAAEVIAVLGAVHAALRDCGPVTRDLEVVRRWLADPRHFSYLAADGFLAYRWADGHDGILVNRAVAASEPTAREIWGIVASHASMARTVRAYLAPSDPLSWLTREADADLARRRRWMLRLLDAPAAITARGFPAGARLAVALQVDDKAQPGNCGLWSLHVSGGRGSFTPFETGRRSRLPPASPVTLGARGLAALYAGVPMSVLRRSGLAAGGDPAADAALDCAFAAEAFMADYF
jgi:predicted acetyltransferase